MSKSRPRYTPEFKRQMVGLFQSGRTLAQLSKEFGCSTWAMRCWIKRSDRDKDGGDGGLTTVEREELTRLRREVRRLTQEREILSKAAAWFAQENVAIPKRSSDL